MAAEAVRLSNIDIDNALKNKDFEVLFQPLFDLSTGAFARVEAFVRWRHPQLGVLPPGAFISYFESQGRMSELTRYVLEHALVEYLNWRGPQGPGFSINLALSDLADDAFAAHLTVKLRDRGIAPNLITLECPMPPVTTPVEQAAAQFARLAETGVRLAIEVRGRANDFLKTISPFPFDEIKTGGAAILRFARTVRGPGLSAISELLEIAKTARCATVAVGVEDQASLAALRTLGFSAAQGNHLAAVGPLARLPYDSMNNVRKLLALPALSDAELAAFAKPAQRLTPAAVSAAKPPPPAQSVEEADDLTATAARLAERAAAEKPRRVEPPTPLRVKIKEALGSARAPGSTAKTAAIARAKQRLETTVVEPPAMPALAAPDAPTPAMARKLYDRLAEAFDVPDDAVREESVSAPVEEAAVATPTLEPTSDPMSAAEEQDGRSRRFARRKAPIVRAGRNLAVPGAIANFRPGFHVALDQRTAAAATRAQAPAPSPRDVAGDLFEFTLDDVAPPRPSEKQRAGVTTAARKAPPSPPQHIAPASPPAPPPPLPALRDAPLDAGFGDLGSLDMEEPAFEIDEDVVVLNITTPEASPPPEAFQAPPSVDTLRAPAAPRRAAPRKVRYYIRMPNNGRLYLPDHFWPKSWKRWWRRRMTAKTR